MISSDIMDRWKDGQTDRQPRKGDRLTNFPDQIFRAYAHQNKH